MSTTESKHVNAKPADHAAAKADVGIELSKKVKEFKREAEEIDAKIQELELKAVREVKEQRVEQILAERSKLESRKQALPVLLRGVQARALHRQSEALYAEAADVKAELDAAELAFESATKQIPELQAQLDQAIEVRNVAEGKRDHLAGQHKSLSDSASYAAADARCIERGEEPKFVPGRFIG